MIRALQRAAIDGWLRVAKRPLDSGAKLFGEEAEIALDRADAGLRDAAGRLLFDDDLREDARLRRAAANERAEALRLREEAAEEASERKRAVRDAEVRREERIESRAKRERLDALDRKAEALDRQADAATARDEALRLRRAADAAKADRKERAKRV
jgi:hypothetical protein